MDTRTPITCDRRYWVALSLASVAGANLGDFCSHVLGLGHLKGLPILLVLFGAVLLAERVSRAATQAFYWTLILIVRTAATNGADLVTHDLAVPYPLFILALAAGLAILVAATRLRSPQGGHLPRTGAAYWAAMLTAGCLGTALGDYCADGAGLGVSLAVWAVVWAVALAATGRAGAVPAAAYWATVTVVRTAGTNAGDFLVGRHGLALGLPAGTGLSLGALVLLLLLWRPAPREGVVRPEAAA